MYVKVFFYSDIPLYNQPNKVKIRCIYQTIPLNYLPTWNTTKIFHGFVNPIWRLNFKVTFRLLFNRYRKSYAAQKRFFDSKHWKPFLCLTFETSKNRTRVGIVTCSTKSILRKFVTHKIQWKSSSIQHTNHSDGYHLYINGMMNRQFWTRYEQISSTATHLIY